MKIPFDLDVLSMKRSTSIALLWNYQGLVKTTLCKPIERRLQNELLRGLRYIDRAIIYEQCEGAPRSEEAYRL